jgi:accessory gene regulator protein AgrB
MDYLSIFFEFLKSFFELGFQLVRLYLCSRFKRNKTMEKGLKIGAMLLLLAGMLSLPKDFYELTKFILIALFGILAYNSHVEANIKGTGLYIALIILFQPFVPIPFGATVWMVIHGAIIAFLGVTLFAPKSKLRKAI